MTQLRHLKDLTKLKIKSVSDIPGKKGKHYAKIEKRVMRRYKAPSLPAYILYEYHFNDQTIPSLSPKLGESVSLVYRIMKDLNIPTRTSPEAHDKRIKLEKLIREEYGISSAKYLDREHNQHGLSLRDMSRELKKELGIDISYQTLANIMEDKGVERRTLSEAAYLAKNKKKKK